jgi:mortality factor 4-like protein 1
MAPSRQQSQPFSKDERVLCFHLDMLYEAKILDIQPAENGEGFQYKIHYKGWKNTWDDWVSIDRIRKFTDENKELASQLHAQMKNLQQKNAKVPKKGGRPNGTDSARGSEERTAGVATQGGRGVRRARDYDLEQVSKYSILPSPRLFCFVLFLLSFILKLFLFIFFCFSHYTLPHHLQMVEVYHPQFRCRRPELFWTL